MKPFERRVWWIMILTMILIWLLIVATAKVEQKFNGDYKLKKPFLVIDSALDVMASTCLQGVKFNLKRQFVFITN